MIVVQLLKCMFRADLVIRTLLSKFRVIGHKRLVLRRVGNARKGGSLGRGLVALLLEEIRRNCPGQDPTIVPTPAQMALKLWSAATQSANPAKVRKPKPMTVDCQLCCCCM
jgi:hypothetical protein